MQKENSTKRRKPVHIPAEFRQASLKLYWALDYKPDGGSCDRLKIHLSTRTASAVKALITRLCKATGTPREGRRHHVDFEAAVRAARRAEIEEGKDPSDIYRLARRIARVCPSTPNEQKAAAQKSEKPQEGKAYIGEGDHSHEHLGLLAGDNLTLVECDDFQPGEVVVTCDKKTEEWEAAGRFVRYEEDDDWGRCPKLAPTGNLYNPAFYRFYRVTSITRTVKVKRPSKGEGEAALREQKIQALRDRLEKIDADDITNCSAILKLEKEIFDLEHPVDSDDWSAWEEGGER